ncbi:glucose-6-phosphate isomerase [Halomicrobium sp. LC1Hm]|uniref:glucose-6-phosphate isomerase n=1 Tax=Halomicrobium sp. LC1Hm TaxID=2610902 RepID=UPI0012983B47|nr:glucose-6-phosphate isomerase [Halomicrobium sp. LC1Hm]QGA81601.1 Glucose-6-phosphate isomerase [Halomicrobium sp. LC1Hm]
MNVDIGNALAAVAEPGLSRDELATLDDRVARAHDRIERGRADDEFGYAALNLPATTDAEAIRDAVAPVSDAETVVTVGIGGSALGARTITSALTADGGTSHVVLDNVDPDHVTRVLSDLSLSETAINVVSKSGTTAETLSNFLVVREAMVEAGVDWTERTVVTTGDEGPLAALADEHDLPTLAVPDGVPGRFAALSSVGLVPAAMLGCDIEGLLDGAAAAAETLDSSLFDCPAYAYGAVAYGLEERGATINAVVPYAERLEPFAEWFAQLWAESLGKDGRGQTPARALGATDQHSQLQLYRAGRRDKLVTLLRPRERPSLDVPAAAADALAHLEGTDLGELLDTELRATEASLAEAGQPNVRVELDRLDPRGLGELLYAMEAACILVGELAGVETFTQPAVEWGKQAARDVLEGDETEKTAAIEDKHELIVDGEDGR